MFRLCTISFWSNVLNIGWFWMEWPLHETAFSFSYHAVLISIAIKKKKIWFLKTRFILITKKMLLFRRIELMIIESLRLLSRHRPVRVRPTTESCLKHHNSSHFIFLVPAITVFSLWNTAAWAADTGDHGGEEPYDERWLERAMVIFSRVCVIRK